MSPREIELATIRTWPAAVTEERNGWFCLAAGGVTGRVNAAWPLGWDGGDLDAAIDDVEAWYAARGLPPRFKLTDGAFAPPELPQALARRGYAPVTPTLVMTTRVAPRDASPDVRMADAMPDEFDAALRETAKDESEYDERRNIALRAPKPTAFATIREDARVAAIGMAACSEDLAGIFLMRTTPEARRRGLARRILRALLARCAAWGARTAFLQVEADNAPAVALYRSEGFTELATYRFWRKG
jgi:ribosomal protein S18 acetylase RimI-like enzyme